MIKNIKGKKFGMLTAIKYLETDANFRSWWLCLCICGKKKVMRLDHIQSKNKSSCGCAYKKHGMIKTRFYRIWRHMKTRCYNPKIPKFSRWGGRGIIVCKSWHDFRNFKKDMYMSYQAHVKQFGEKNTQIDRIDNNGNYSKKNCRWATFKQQANNSSNVRFIKFNNKRLSISEWSRRLNINYGTLYTRIRIYNWPIQKAFIK